MGLAPCFETYLESFNYRDIQLSRTKKRPNKILSFFVFSVFPDIILATKDFLKATVLTSAKRQRLGAHSLISKHDWAYDSKDEAFLPYFDYPLGYSLIVLLHHAKYMQEWHSNFIWLPRARWLHSFMESVNIKWR